MLRVEGLPTHIGGASLTFDVAESQCAGLLGRDLAVLLTLAENITGLRAPVTGRVLLDDIDTHRDRERARARIAVGLSRAAHPLTTLVEHAATVSATRAALRISVPAAIARLGLNAGTRLSTPAAKSAAALLAALLPDVGLVVLHDPFRGLDAGTRTNAIDWIRSLGSSRTSVVITGAEERDVRAVSHFVIDVGAGR